MSKNLRFTLLGLFAIMLTFGFTVKTQAQDCDPMLTSYSVTLLGIEYTAPVDHETRTVAFTVPFGTADLLGDFDLIGTFTIDGDSLTHSEDPAVLQRSDTTANDFSTPVAFTVHGSDGETTCTVEYFVTITEAENGGNELAGMNFAGSFSDCYDNEYPVIMDFVMDSVTYGSPVWVASVPYGTNLDDVLIKPILDSLSIGATIVPSPILAVTDSVLTSIEVRATNLISTKKHTFIVYADKVGSDAHELLSFNFMMAQNPGLTADVIGVVDSTTHRVDLVVPFGTDVTQLITCYEVSDYACFYRNGPEDTDAVLQMPCEYVGDGMTRNDFTDPTHFTVIAQDGVTEDTYNVVVTFEEPETDNSLTNLDIDGLIDCNGHGMDMSITNMDTVYTLRLRTGLDEQTMFEVTFDIDSLATAVPASGFMTTFVDTVGVEIVVTAQSGDSVTYVLMPAYEEASDVKEIVSFSFEAYDVVEETGNHQFNQTYMGVIDQDAKTILVQVPFGTDLDSIAASFTLNDDYASMTHSEENNDEQVPQMSGKSFINYETPAAFTVFAEDCSTVEYFVTVEEGPNEGNGIEDFVFLGTQYSDCRCGDENVVKADEVVFTGNEIHIFVPHGTDFTDFELDIVLEDTLATTDPTFPLTGYKDTVFITVTAADGLAEMDYILIMEESPAATGNQILTYGFKDTVNMMPAGDVWGDIDEEKNRIDVVVPFGTPATELIASFTNSPMSCVYINGEDVTDGAEQCSEITENDFTTYLTYTVIAQNGDEAYYNVYVDVLPADSAQDISNFMVVDLPECFGDETYDVIGEIDGTAISVEVKEGTDVTALEVEFDIPETATVSPAEGVYDFTSPVTFTVTAQDGTSTDYVVTVTIRDGNAEKMILTYEIDGNVGTIDQTHKVIEVWMPKTTEDVTALVADFTLSDGAKMTHSEDTPVLQVSGVTPNNFETPVAYTVWAEDCTTLEYFVIVRVTPNVDTDINQFVVDYTGCGCDLETKIDDFAKRIYVKIPYEDEDGVVINLATVDVVTIGIADGATVNPGTGITDFSDGPVLYTVTAPDGVTKVVWEVMVENPPCTGTDILDWTFQGDVQIGDADIDEENHTIEVLLLPGTDLTEMYADTELECGADICCSAGNCAGQAIDFSEDSCHTCVVTAQDKSITQDWTICVKFADLQKPEAFTNNVLAHNCNDSVMVWGDKDGGTIYIVDDETADAVNALVNNWTDAISDLGVMEAWLAMNEEAEELLDDAVDAHMGASAGYPYADSMMYLHTDGLFSGVYYAFLVDASGNVSCSSVDAVFIDLCVVTVANLCDLRDGTGAYMYVVEGEVLVSYEEGNMKFVQDDGCGIKVIDELDAWPAVYGEGQGLTNIKGTVHDNGVEMVFTPVCCYTPDKTSTGNVITPIELTFDQFLSDVHTHSSVYESMLVKITDPMIAFDDYSSENPLWAYDMLDLATVNAKGDYEYFIQKVFNANYIGKVIPTDPTIYQGIRTNVDWWGDIYGLITPRKKTDIIEVTGGLLMADPNPTIITGVSPGACGSGIVTIINQGIGNVTISALYLDDAAATDEFELIDPTQVPFTLGTWESMEVQVDFCPKDAGAESTTLLVEYGDGKVMEVPINGETVLVVPAPYFTNFNNDTPGSIDGWKATNMDHRNTTYNWGVDGQAYMYAWSWWGYVGGETTILESPGFDLSSTTNTTVTWWTGTYYNARLRVDMSYDKATWTTVHDFGTFTNGNGAGKYMSVDLSAYDGETIFLRWVGGGSYFGIDNVSVDQKITDPVFKASPEALDLGGVQVNESGTGTITITNDGVSILEVKKVELVAGSEFTLTDANTYPAEVVGSSYAFGNDELTELTFDVTFSPTDIGIKTAKVLVTYGMYEEKVVEIPVMGEGLSCYTATEAFVGENWAAGQNSWFTYTAEKFQIVNINSCHVNQDVSEDESYAYDTWLYVYSDCEGTLLAENDDLGWDGCVYNRASSGVEFAMNEGETVKIFWPWEFSSDHDDEGFYFNIDPSYPVDGDVCETAIALTLPVVNHFGSTTKFEDDYDMSPCSPFSNYMDGNDKVYSITLDVEGYLTGSILGAYGSIHVLDKCPVEELEKRNCKAFASGPNGGDFTKRIQPGFYYVIISTWAPPQTVDYLLNMSFEELSTGIDDGSAMNSLVVYPNPTQGMFTVSISQAEASDLTLELVNISGQVVYRNEVKSVYSYNEEIDASSFAKGVYYLKVNDGEEVKIEKVVIQ